jgi:uncharacterized Zn-binding protein involved in type VI secretion
MNQGDSMFRPFIVVGDPTSHGGIVIGSTQLTDTHGKRLARVGDQVTCPKKGHGTTVIVTGDPAMIVDGAPVARHGDRCACGAILISSQVVSGTSENASHGAAASSEAQTHAIRDAFSVATLSITQVEELEQYFEVIDATTGEPVQGLLYKLAREGHAIEDGAMLDNGRTRGLPMADYKGPLEFTAWIPMESQR